MSKTDASYVFYKWLSEQPLVVKRLVIKHLDKTKLYEAVD